MSSRSQSAAASTPLTGLTRKLTSLDPAMIAMAAWVCGIGSAVFDALFRDATGQAEKSFIINHFRHSWRDFWIGSMLVGMLTGILWYWVGGWFYHVRIRWCGAYPVDKRLARRAYVLTGLISALPLIAVAVYATVQFPAPGAKLLDGRLVLGLDLVATLLAVLASYK